MAKFTAPVQDHLILPARIRLTPGRERQLQSRGQVVPTPVTIRLLIDTGSKRSALIPGLFRHFQMMAHGSARVVTSLGKIETSLYWVCLDFPEARLESFPEVLVARLPMPGALAQCHGLLGRDLLRRLESFDYEGRRGRYSIRDRPGPLAWLRRWL